MDEDPYGFFGRDDATVHYSAPASPASHRSYSPGSPSALLPSHFEPEELPVSGSTAKLDGAEISDAARVVPIATPLRNMEAGTLLRDCTGPQVDTVPDDLFDGRVECFALLSSTSDNAGSAASYPMMASDVSSSSVVPHAPASPVIPMSACATHDLASSAACCPVAPHAIDATSTAASSASDVPSHGFSSEASHSVIPKDVSASDVPSHGFSSKASHSVIPKDVSASDVPSHGFSSDASDSVIPKDVSASDLPSDGFSSEASPSMIYKDVSASDLPSEGFSSEASPSMIPMKDVSASDLPSAGFSSEASRSMVIQDVSARDLPSDGFSAEASVTLQDMSASDVPSGGISSEASRPMASAGADEKISTTASVPLSASACVPMDDVRAAAAYEDTLVMVPGAHVHECQAPVLNSTAPRASAKSLQRRGSSVSPDLSAKIARLQLLKHLGIA